MSLLVPDIATASADELSDWFPMFDGAWSRQTRALVNRFGAQGLDLNDNWTSVSPSWMCPCCGRWKPDLPRLSSTGILLCHLEEHHDHLRDRGKAILRARNPLPPPPQRRDLLRSIDACKDLIERFYRTLICKDCNAAEGEAKARLRGGVDKDFSFSPSEIRRFITVRPNVPHDVDGRVAAEIWDAVRPEFEDQIAFAEVLAERIAAGRHQKEGSPPHFRRAATSEAILYTVSLAQCDIVKPLYGLASDLSARSVARQGMGSASSKSRRSGVAPSEAEFAAFDAAQDDNPFWRNAPDTWRCEVCDRGKRDTLRKSNRGAWTGRIHRWTVYMPEEDPASLWWREPDVEGGPVFGDHRHATICQDCRLLATDVNKLTAGVAEACLTPDDLREFISDVRPNMRHEVDLSAAVVRAQAQSARQEAAAAYHRHASEALMAEIEVKQVRRDLGCGVAEAVVAIAWGDPQRDAKDSSVIEQHLSWLLQEAERLSRYGAGG